MNDQADYADRAAYRLRRPDDHHPAIHDVTAHAMKENTRMEHTATTIGPMNPPTYRASGARRTLVAGIGGLVLALSCVTAHAAPHPASAQEEDAAAIRRLYAGIDAAWDASNARAFANYWTVNGILTSPLGQTSVGRAAIAHDIAAELAYLKGARHTLTIARLSWPTPEVAVVDGAAVISNAKSQNGAPLPPLTARFTSVCVERPGDGRRVAYLVSYRFLPASPGASRPTATPPA